MRSTMTQEPVNETALSRQLRLVAQEYGALLMRNNSGAMIDKTGRMVRFGLGNDSKAVSNMRKSSDLIGLTAQGRFLAVESKDRGWIFTGTPREVAQHTFLQLVNVRGGIGLFATSTEDLRRVLSTL